MTTRTMSRFEQLSFSSENKSAIEMRFPSPPCSSPVIDQPYGHGSGSATTRNKKNKKSSYFQPPKPLQDDRGTLGRTKIQAPLCVLSPCSLSPWTPLYATSNINLHQRPQYPTNASTTFVDSCARPPRLIIGKKLALQSNINRPLVDKKGLQMLHPAVTQNCMDTVLQQITTRTSRGPMMMNDDHEHHHHDNHDNLFIKQGPFIESSKVKASEEHTYADADSVANTASQEQDVTITFEDKDALFPIPGPFLAKGNAMTPCFPFLEDSEDMIDDTTLWEGSSHGHDEAIPNIIETGEEVGTLSSKKFKTSSIGINISKESTLEDLHHQRYARVSLQSQSQETMDLPSCTYLDAVTKGNRNHQVCMFKTNQKRPLMMDSSSPSLDERPLEIVKPLPEPISSIAALYRPQAVGLTSAHTNKTVELRISIHGVRWGCPIVALLPRTSSIHGKVPTWSCPPVCSDRR